MHRTFTHVITAAATVGFAIGLFSAAPASAASTACSEKVLLPTRVSIDRSYQEVRAPLSTSCTSDYVSFDLYGPKGFDDIFIYDPAYDGALDTWDVYSFQAPGTYRTRSSVADSPVVTETLLKFGSKAGLSGRRAGSTVTLTACASYFNGNRDVFVPWAGDRATIQKLGSDGRTWQFVRTVTLNRSGCAAYPLTSKYAGTYRVSSYETYQIFGRTSPSIRL